MESSKSSDKEILLMELAADPNTSPVFSILKKLDVTDTTVTLEVDTVCVPKKEQRRTHQFDRSLFTDEEIQFLKNML